MTSRPGPASLKIVAVTAASQNFLQADARRRRIVVSSHATATITISDENPAVGERGIVIHPGLAPVAICCCDYGDFPQRQLQIIGDGNATIGIVSSFEDIEQ